MTITYQRYVGGLSTSRFDFQSHIDGTGFRQTAATVDTTHVMTGLGSATTVQQALDWLEEHGGGGGGGVINLSDLSETEGILPIVRGGTGLSTIGSNGQVLTSNGTSAFWSAPTGEANTTSNTGSGIGLAEAKSGVNLPFKSLVQGANITLTDNGTSVTIAATGTGGVVDLSNLADTTGVLPIIRGGTGLSSVGSSGTVLTTDGSNMIWSQIVDANVSSSAAISYSKLSLTNHIVNSDVSSSANIAVSKLAGSSTDGYVLSSVGGSALWAPNSGSGVINLSSLASTSGVLPIVRGGTNLNNAGSANTVLLSNGTSVGYGQIVDAYVSSSANIAASKLAAGSANTVLTSNGTVNSFNLLLDANISSSANIAVSKLAAGSDTYVLTSSGGVASWQSPPASSDTFTTEGGFYDWTITKVGGQFQFRGFSNSLPLEVGYNSTYINLSLGGLTSFGSVGQSMRVAASGSSLEWFTPSSGGGGSASVGSSGQIDTADGAGGWQAPTGVFAGSTYISFGTGLLVPATSGYLRTPNNNAGGGGIVMAQRNHANSTDFALLATDDSGGLWISSDNFIDSSSQFTKVTVSPTTSVNLLPASSPSNSKYGVYVTTTNIQSGLPRLGLYSPGGSYGDTTSTTYASDGEAAVVVNSTPYTLTPAQYSRKILKLSTTTTGTLTVLFPQVVSEDGSYEKTIRVTSFESESTLIFSTGSGTTLTLSGATYTEYYIVYLIVTTSGVSGVAIGGVSGASNVNMTIGS